MVDGDARDLCADELLGDVEASPYLEPKLIQSLVREQPRAEAPDTDEEGSVALGEA